MIKNIQFLVSAHFDKQPTLLNSAEWHVVRTFREEITHQLHKFAIENPKVFIYNHSQYLLILLCEESAYA